MRFMLGAINTFRKLIGKNRIRVAEVQMEGIVGWLAKGYKTYTEREQA